MDVVWKQRWAACLLLSVFAAPGSHGLRANLVRVRNPQGVGRAFAVLRSSDGAALADGDMVATLDNNQMQSRTSFHFKDGSTYDETVVFSQSGDFKLVRYHLVQKGPAFKIQEELSMDAETGRVRLDYTDERGKSSHFDDRMSLPADLANGLLAIVAKDVDGQATVSFLSAGPKPRLIKMRITRNGSDNFSVAGSVRQAAHYVVHVEIGGIEGAIAPLVGKQPPDLNLWYYGQQAPLFVRFQGPLYDGGPIWIIEPIGPTWPSAAKNHS